MQLTKDNEQRNEELHPVHWSQENALDSQKLNVFGAPSSNQRIPEDASAQECARESEAINESQQQMEQAENQQEEMEQRQDRRVSDSVEECLIDREDEEVRT